MKFSGCDKTMFQTVFSPSAGEARTLLDFMRYLWDEQVGEQIAGHPLYCPSALWKQWAGQTFTGFSLEKILLQGGHAFPSSVEVGMGREEGSGFPFRSAASPKSLAKSRSAASWQGATTEHVGHIRGRSSAARRVMQLVARFNL